MQYFFILGRNPELSLAEIHALLPANYTLRAFFREVAIVECAQLEVETLMRRLGGTIKIGEIVSHNPSQPPLILRGGDDRDPPLKVRGGRGSYAGILDVLTTHHSTNKKFFLGLSAYALDGRAHLPNVRQLREIGMEMKRELQTPSESSPHPALSLGERGWGEGKKGVRLVTSKDIALSSVIVKKEKLLTQGAEIVMFYGTTNHNTQPLTPNPYNLTPQYIGRTLAVQEFEQASARDFGRPERSMGVGMLPVQLAKILINLARAPSSGTLLDPFCGFGTILGEAWLMGYRKLIGSDIEQEMVDATLKNLEWLTKIPPLRVRGGEEGLRAPHNSPHPSLNLREGVTLFASPVEQLSKHLPPRSVDAIVTEPYLGPTRQVLGDRGQVLGLIDLYIGAFREFAKILKPGGKVVFIFPTFVTKRRRSSLSDESTKTSSLVIPKIKDLGFQPIQLLPDTCHLKPVTSILYSRPDQRVLREIFVLEFKK